MKKHDKEHPFKVPEDYFKNFPEKLQNRIADNRPVSLMRRPEVYWAAAAAVVIMVLSIVLRFSGEEGTSAQRDFMASLQQEDIIAYLDASELYDDDIIENIEFTEDEWEAIFDDTSAVYDDIPESIEFTEEDLSILY